MIIYLADLTHCTITISNDAFPLNIGLVGTYIKTIFPDAQVELFKYPHDLKDAIDHKQPDILGCSNYPWNLELGLSFLRYVKKKDKKIITVMGGPNISYDIVNINRFLNKHNEILDFHTLFEGEHSFRYLVESAISNDFNINKMKKSSIKGCVYFIDGKTETGGFIEREKELIKFPSPYLSGFMDKFFDGILSPMIETHRGCPFSCTYCHEGYKAYNKVNRHDTNRIFDELEYISSKVGGQVKNLMIADPNFGMFKDDILIAEKIKDVYNRSGYPNNIFSTTAKNEKDRLVKISKLLKPISMPIWLSVQSMTDNVLKNIKRSNIKTNELIGIQKELESDNISSKSELIMCLPGETFETHLNSIIKLIELGIDLITCYQLMLVKGSEMSLNMSTGHSTKFRVIPRSFSKLSDIGFSLETEEIVISTEDFPFDDYLKARQLHLLISIYLNGKGFKGFFKYITEHKLDMKTFLSLLLDRFMDVFNIPLQSFIDDTVNELFDSEDEITLYYSLDENFQRLIEGYDGTNLLQKYTCQFYIEDSDKLVDIISDTIHSMAPSENNELDNIRRYYHCLFYCFLDINRREIISKDNFDYDISSWLSHPTKRLNDFKYKEMKTITFTTPETQFQTVESYFKRYGRNAQSFGKILTKLWICDILRVYDE